MVHLQNFKDSKDFQWLLGFIEAESSFYVSKRKFYGEERFHVTLSILQPFKKTQILYYIKRLFGCGHIRTTNVGENSQSPLKSWSSNMGSRHDRRFIFSKLESLESPISTYYITNKKYLSCVLFLLKQGASSLNINQKGGINTLKFYDYEKILRALTIYEKKGCLRLIKQMGDALGGLEERPLGSGSRLNYCLKSPKDSSFEEWLTGAADGGGVFTIGAKSRAEYEIKDQSHRKTMASYKNSKKIISSFIITRKIKTLSALAQLKGKPLGYLGLKLNMKGSAHAWEISNKKALAQIKILFKKHSLRTKKKVEFLKWCKPLSCVIEDRPRSMD
uniref:Homing endonuclease n=1 Tax=Stichopathes sp. n. NB-2020 TaxID=2733775 RepID=A0A6M4RN27_9CNID|nr:homing endonuclease [Stichopathes sp. n. NB-2020]